MSQDLIAEAYNAVKVEGDPDYAGVAGTYKEELAARADGVARTGVTINPFEAKYKELLDAQKKEAPETPLGTTNGINEAPPKTKSAAAGASSASSEESSGEASGEKPLEKMSRAELDEIAKSEFGFNPSDYSNKAEIVAAIEEARSK